MGGTRPAIGLGAVAAVVAVACVSPEALVPCGEVYCAGDALCVGDGAAAECRPRAQAEACAGQPALATCRFGGVDGVCRDGLCVAAECGNGALDPGEVCDDGAAGVGVTCSALCDSDLTCGNGVVDYAVGEECDDGGLVDHDGCQSTCVLQRCGDGFLDDDEACDDGNRVDGDGCSATCASDETCGNGVRDPGEACDDGNLASGDGCQASCALPRCGDDIVDVAEGEACDDGNRVDGDGCNASCTSDETCGNGVTDFALGEECDDGNLADHDGCQSTCVVQRCGDGIVDGGAGEECDDGNPVNTDACLNSCQAAQCGDGVVWQNIEQCDDADGDDHDGCTRECLPCGTALGQADTVFDLTAARCYLAFGEVKTWTDTEAFCQSLGGHTARVDNAFDQGLLADLASTSAALELVGGVVPLWLGLEFPDDGSGTLDPPQWTDGTAYVPGVSYHGWDVPFETVATRAASGEAPYSAIREDGVWATYDRFDENIVLCQLADW
ncbi:MAG: DUF4215 domain-containing protein [Kofleriaceae bacterium]